MCTVPNMLVKNRAGDRIELERTLSRNLPERLIYNFEMYMYM